MKILRQHRGRHRHTTENFDQKSSQGFVILIFHLCLTFVYFTSSNVRAVEKSYETIGTKCSGAKTSWCESKSHQNNRNSRGVNHQIQLSRHSEVFLLYFGIPRFGMGRVRKKRKGAKYNYDKNRRKEWKKAKKLPTIGWLVKNYFSRITVYQTVSQ